MNALALVVVVEFVFYYKESLIREQKQIPKEKGLEKHGAHGLPLSRLVRRVKEN